MELEIKVVSKAMIKPASPTPYHLRSYQLSFLDQISPPVFNPFVLFYSSDQYGDTGLNITKISFKLKKSLSDILTLFYPLAGRVKDNLLVDCNDEGIPYIEARVKGQLSDFIQVLAPTDFNKFLPFALDDHEEADHALAGIQVNIFDCGGIAIGSCVSHKIADALSNLMFLKSWAHMAQGSHMVPCPEFVSATLFPPKNISGYDPRVGITTNKNKVISKRFLFSALMIEGIRAKYTGSNGLESEKRPTRVEALSTFIWSRFMAATRKEYSGPERIYAIIHAVNLRTRIDPPLPEYSFGNLYRIAMTFPRLDTEQEDGFGLVKQVRDQISRIDKDYVKKLREGSDHLDFLTDVCQDFSKGELVSLSFTSLCRFPLYEYDFGWGKPAWIGSPALTFKNLVIFMDTKSGDGIEAYINLEEDDMAKFESDHELLAFVSPTGLN